MSVMFESKVFRLWFVAALAVWFVLFNQFNQLSFLIEHWYYPAIMVAGALLVAFGLPPVLQLASVPALRVMRRDVGELKHTTLMVWGLGLGGAPGVDFRFF